MQNNRTSANRPYRRPAQSNYNRNRLRRYARRNKIIKIAVCGLILISIIIVVVVLGTRKEAESNRFSQEVIDAANRETDVERTLRTYTAKPTAYIPVVEPVAPIPTIIEYAEHEEQIFPQIILDKNGLVISITGFKDYSYGYSEIRYTIENNSGIDLTVNLGNLNCDGWQILEYTSYDTVKSGTKAGGTITIWDNQLSACSMNSRDLKNVSFKGVEIRKENDYLSAPFKFDADARLQ